MRQMKRRVLLAMSMCLLMSFSVFANTLSREENSINNEKISLSLTDKFSAFDEYRTVARGDFLSSGSTEIINEANGNIRINIDTYAHHDVDRIFHTVFLDKWNEDDQDWYQVEYWNFVKSKEETSNGRLSDLSTTIVVMDQETNKYYRVRGLHGVEYNDEVEACATETNGILITDGPT